MRRKGRRPARRAVSEDSDIEEGNEIVQVVEPPKLVGKKRTIDMITKISSKQSEVSGKASVASKKAAVEVAKEESPLLKRNKVEAKDKDELIPGS